VGLIPGEIRRFYFYMPSEVKSYRVWLMGSKRKTRAGSRQKLISRKPSEAIRDHAGKVSETPDGHNRLKGIRTGDSKDGFQIQIIADDRIEKYTHFFMNTPPRLVLDLPGKWERPRDARIRLNNIWVKRIRVGRHSDKLRLVLDLVAGASMPPAVIRESPDGLLITIKN